MDVIKILFEAISRFLQFKPYKLRTELRRNPEILHYHNEIIRFWSQLNFIMKKTLRALDTNNIEWSDFEISGFLYVIYRVIHEHSTMPEIKKEFFSSPSFLDNQSYNNILKVFLKKLSTFSMKIALQGKNKEEKLSINEAIPLFTINNLSRFLPFDFIKQNFREMNYFGRKDTFSVRLNRESNLNSWYEIQDKIIEELNKNYITFYKDEFIPYLIHIPISQKSNLIRLKCYEKGILVIQDKGSAIIGHLMNPHQDEKILDMCAAPGMKTSQFAQELGLKSQIIASEFRKERALSTKYLLNKLNLNQVNVLNADSIEFPVRGGILFDKILLDAPCTGSGTFKNNPEIKWRQNRGFLYQNVIIQEKLLDRALQLLKPKGVLVYSTCSLYPEEGELQIKKIFHNLEPLEIPEFFSPPYRIKNFAFKGMGRLFPSIHHTEGFFVGKFKKKATCY